MSINRREFLHSAAGLAAAAAFPAFVRDLRLRDKPNVLLIVSDDLGYADLSITGRSDYSTPVLDQLAREGTLLTQAYSSAPVCTPTRVALNTGRYPARYVAGLYEPLTMQALGLPPSPPTFARLMKNAGYDTALIGKWHLGTHPEFHPLRHGYDEFYGFLGPGADYISHVDVAKRDTSYFQEGDKTLHVPGYLTDLFTDRTVQILQRKHARPFFINLQYNAPHWPWQAPGDAPYPDTLRMAAGGSPETFARMVRSMDEGVARILAELHTRGLERDTLVIFTSDNGGERYSQMGPFAKGKMTCWEGGIRVAAMARWPGVIDAGAKCDQVTASFDWTATVVKLAGGHADARVPFDGIDVMPQLRGAKPRLRDVYWRVSQRQQQKAVRSGDWKYLQTKDAEYLFNLIADPGEKHDRKTDEPTRFAELKAKLAKWESHMLKPVPLDPGEG